MLPLHICASAEAILIGSASEKETLRSNFPEDLECLMTATSDEELLDFFVVDVVRRLEKIMNLKLRSFTLLMIQKGI